MVTYSGSVEKPHILESTGNGVLVVDYDGDGTFEEVGTWTGCAYNADGNSQGSMGVGLGD